MIVSNALSHDILYPSFRHRTVANSFDARLRVTPRSQPIGISFEQLLPQATFLRNTDWAYSLAVYTGDETKLGAQFFQLDAKSSRLSEKYGDRDLNSNTKRDFFMYTGFANIEKSASGCVLIAYMSCTIQRENKVQIPPQHEKWRSHSRTSSQIFRSLAAVKQKYKLN